MRQKSSSGKWRSRQNVASGGKGSKGSGGKELNYQTQGFEKSGVDPSYLKTALKGKTVS